MAITTSKEEATADGKRKCRVLQIPMHLLNSGEDWWVASSRMHKELWQHLEILETFLPEDHP